MYMYTNHSMKSLIDATHEYCAQHSTNYVMCAITVLHLSIVIIVHLLNSYQNMCACM